MLSANSSHGRGWFRRAGSTLLPAALGCAALLCAALLCAARAEAAAITWTGATSTEWNLAGNWSGNAIPGAGDNVTIPAGVASGRYPVVSTAPANAKTLALTAGAGTAPALNLSANTLTVVSTLTIGAGTITVSGGTLAAGAGASISGTLSLGGGTCLGAGDITISSGGSLGVSNAATLHLASAIGTNPTNSVAIAAGGTLTQSGGAVDTRDLTTTAGAPNGTYAMSGGTCKVYRDFKSSGTFAATGGLVDFLGSPTAAAWPTTTGPTQFYGVQCDVDPGFAANGTVSFAVAGGWTANAAVNLSGKAVTVTFNGTGAQAIGGTAATTFRNVIVNKAAGTATLARNATVTNGDLTITAGTLDLAGFTLNRSASGGVLTVANGAFLKVGGTNGFPSGYATHTLGGTSTVEYEGTNQTVTNEAYGNLTLSGSGTKTMPNTALAIAGSFTMTGTPSATAKAALNVAGGFTVGNGCTFVTGAFAHDLKGDLSNSGTFTATGSTITLDGTSDQAVGGTVATTFANLTVNKAATRVNVNTGFSVAGTLTLTSGVVTNGANTITITATGSVARTSGWINGNLKKNVATGSGVSRTFEIGGATSYTPVTIAFASVSVTGDMLARNTAGDHPSIASSDVNPSKSVNRYWTLGTSGGLTFTTFGATFTFVAGDVDAGATTANFVVRRWSGSAWSNTTIGARTATTTQITGQATIGDFQIGDVLSVSATTSTFAFGTQPLNTWLNAQSSVITNDGTETEAIVARISTPTAGANAWSLSTVSNGANQIRAQWSTSSATGPWTDISAYGSNFTVSSSLTASSTLTLYLRILTPTSSAAFGPYSSTLTVTAQ